MLLVMMSHGVFADAAGADTGSDGEQPSFNGAELLTLTWKKVDPIWPNMRKELEEVGGSGVKS